VQEDTDTVTGNGSCAGHRIISGHDDNMVHD
jgi:hypothetical protein